VLFALAAVLSLCTPLVIEAAPAAATVDRAPQVLEGHRWTLDAATDGQGKRLDVTPTGSPPFVFRFAGSRLVVQGGCNQLMGSFRIDAAGRLDVGHMASTMKACDAPLMQADTVLSALLAKPWRMEVTDGAQPRLRLTSTTNEILALVGQPTPEMLYGPGTRMFLEVAPQRVACANPLTGETSCLQVRERRYDDHGLRVGVPGEWQPLYEPIEGFVHAEGERKVLRLMRYQRSPAPPGAPATVYVLDMVVETEIVKR
jgi:heat shock protein HslJ